MSIPLSMAGLSRERKFVVLPFLSRYRDTIWTVKGKGAVNDWGSVCHKSDKQTHKGNRLFYDWQRNVTKEKHLQPIKCKSKLKVKNNNNPAGLSRTELNWKSELCSKILIGHRNTGSGQFSQGLHLSTKQEQAVWERKPQTATFNPIQPNTFQYFGLNGSQKP